MGLTRTSMIEMSHLQQGVWCMQPEANPKVARSFAGPWLGRVWVAHLLAAGLVVAMVPQRAMALGLGEESAANVTMQVAGDDLPVGEDVGEPAEDAPVEGEPKAGEAPDLPAEEAVDVPDDPTGEPGYDPAAGLSGND
jgi:hypothetical protein